MAKTIRDLNTKHFSRHGEFLVSAELAKHGWNVYTPMYDEYIDLIAHKFSCENCDELWDMTIKKTCKKCHKNYSSSMNKLIAPKFICDECGYFTKKSGKCPDCNIDLSSKPTCSVNDCNGVIDIIKNKCKYCEHKKYIEKKITVQVKSSRIEDGKDTYAVDPRLKDLLDSKTHFYIWCLVDDYGKSDFIVMSVDDFKETGKKDIETVSFFKDTCRLHFPMNDFKKWTKYKNEFTKLG